MFHTSQKWLSDNIIGNNKNVIVLTHHLPSYDLIIDKYKKGIYSKYQDRFASDLNHLLQSPVKYWLCGHSHCNIEKQINDVMCAINAYGYPLESDKKNPELYLKTIALE
jgi:hypothetical protein